MTNAESIATAQVLAGIPLEIECHTFQEWKSRGRMVKKGEKAAFKTSLWLPKASSDAEKKTGFFCKTGFFFMEGQTKEMNPATQSEQAAS